MKLLKGKKILFGCIGVFMTAHSGFALSDGLARTPPMGFNSWNYFGCNGVNVDGIKTAYLTDTVVRQIADSMVSSGMKDAGYRYIVLDDCWANATRNSKTQGIEPRKDLYPSGLRPLANYLRSKGLKFGIYMSAFVQTCQKTMPGVNGHYQQDADSLVAWGVEFLKLDDCFSNGPMHPHAVQMRNAMKTAVNNARNKGDTSAHHIVLSIARKSRESEWLWIDTVAHMWRVTQDIGIHWDDYCTPNSWDNSVTEIIDLMANRYSISKPGTWNDADMLEVGNDGFRCSLTDIENQSHFAMWCIFPSPLIAGNDLRRMRAPIKNILTNKEVIGVNQDVLGEGGRRLVKSTSTEIWVKRLLNTTNTDFAIVLFNRGSTAANITLDLNSIKSGYNAGFDPAKACFVRDLIAKTNLPNITNASFTATAVPAHGVRMIQISTTPLPHATAISTQLLPGRNTGAGLHLNNRTIHIFNSKGGTSSFSLIDLKGAGVFQKEFTGNAPQVISIAQVRPGIYFAKLRTEHQSTIRKLVIR